MIQFRTNISRLVNEKLFFILLVFLLMLCFSFYNEIVLTSRFNLFPLVANVILISLLPFLKSYVEKEEVYKLIVVSGFFMYLNLTNHTIIWLEMALFNFYCLMYVLFFYCYGRKVKLKNKLQKGYVCFINFLLVIYVTLVNIEIIMDNLFLDVSIQQRHYFDMGAKMVIIFISVLTFLSFIIQNTKGIKLKIVGVGISFKWKSKLTKTRKSIDFFDPSFILK